MWNQFIQRQTGDECTDNRLQTGNLRKKCRKENYRQHENIMCCLFTFDFLEKPFGNFWDNTKHDKQEQDKGNAQCDPEFLIDRALASANDDRKDNQYSRVGQYRSSNGNGYRLSFGNTIAIHNRI